MLNMPLIGGLLRLAIYLLISVVFVWPTAIILFGNPGIIVSFASLLIIILFQSRRIIRQRESLFAAALIDVPVTVVLVIANAAIILLIQESHDLDDIDGILRFAGVLGIMLTVTAPFAIASLGLKDEILFQCDEPGSTAHNTAAPKLLWLKPSNGSFRRAYLNRTQVTLSIGIVSLILVILVEWRQNGSFSGQDYDVIVGFVITLLFYALTLSHVVFYVGRRLRRLHEKSSVHLRITFDVVGKIIAPLAFFGLLNACIVLAFSGSYYLLDRIYCSEYNARKLLESADCAISLENARFDYLKLSLSISIGAHKFDDDGSEAIENPAKSVPIYFQIATVWVLVIMSFSIVLNRVISQRENGGDRPDRPQSPPADGTPTRANEIALPLSPPRDAAV